MRAFLYPLLILYAVLVGPVAASAPAVPPQLSPWVPWVLHPQDQRPCPVQADSAQRLCAWPGRLALDLNARGGTFSQHWEADAETWAPLPGDPEHWPQEVRDGDRPLPVVLREGAPSVKLTPGAHRLTGRFQWSDTPDGLTLPAETGLLSLVLDGAAVPFPRLDRDGRLWLGDPAAVNALEGDRLALQVYRRIDDDLPLQVTTRLELDVAGGARQVLIGPVLLPGTIPLRVDSPLPARLDGDGGLRVQVRPGHWVVNVDAQVGGAVGTLTRATAPAPWPALEVWSFAAHPDLRQVELRGPAAVDPRQAGVPADWAALPAYRLAPGETLTLAERRRGNPDPGPDRLTLERDLWLDLTGDAFSVRDRIGGQLTRSWRLGATAPLTLGRVAVDGEPCLITRLRDTDPPGVEVRRGRLDLVADSRIAGASGNPRTIPAAGWGLQLDGSRAHLYLPPGWDLLAATGTDNRPDSWLGRWTLLDLFLVLILSFGVGRLWGTPWGLLAGLALLLTWQVPTAPRLVWVHLLAVAALLRLLPEHPTALALVRVRALLRWYRYLALLALVLIGLPFVAGQVRTGLYPHLERPAVGLGTNATALNRLAPPAAAPQPAVAERQFEAILRNEPMEEAATADDSAGSLTDNARARKSLARSAAPPAPAAPAPERPDPDAVIQSGAGIPDWQWNRFDLSWSGAIDPAEGAKLWLLSPGWNLLWSLLGALLAVILGLRVADLIGRPRPPSPAGAPESEPDSELAGQAASSRPASASLGLLLALILGAGGLLGPTPTQASDLPSVELLEELRTRLLAPPDCLPDCVDLADLALAAEPETLRLILTLDAAAPVATAVPGVSGGWRPTELDLDGAPFDGLRRDPNDRLLIALPAGRHRLTLTGPLPHRNQVEIPFPLHPRRLQATLDGWTLEGLDAAGLPGAQIRLVRVSTDVAAGRAALSQGALPALLRVERELRIGLDWRLATRVRRLSPAEFPVSVPVPLLPGESVQTPGLRVQDGRVLVSLAPDEIEAGWTSTLEPAPTLQLTAATDPQLNESWSLALSPRWHLEWTGPAPIHQITAADRWQPSWRPLPGETLALNLTQPAAVPGQTLTIDRVLLRETLGQRTNDSELRLDLRGGQGGLHPIRLPPGAEPTHLQVNGQDLPLPKAGAVLEIPLVPGQQSVLIQWRTPQAPGLLIKPQLPDLGSPAVNLNLTLRLPQDRWVLLTGGPRIGPVVVFWGVLLVLAGLSLALGRSHLTALKTHDWLLLGAGLALAEIWVLVLVAGWLLALGGRQRLYAATPRRRYNLVQVTLVVLTLAAGVGLVGAVSQGLLGAPAMQIVGNGSGDGVLNWYQDRTAGPLPPIWVMAVPMWVYRTLMLAWALWLAVSLLRWLRWGWAGFSQPVLWRPGPPRHPRDPGSTPAPTPGATE
ncbi:hypothetical protein [uncultured Thiodictyon sp.]|uniref:hypothetical protein n=1 Tax=uncultured Thiodictyon sp. TaxID=1846217 RepID=UPI0025D4947E|nr:hypothetical protein [uncultured Thiodictyon sp.]